MRRVSRIDCVLLADHVEESRIQSSKATAAAAQGHSRRSAPDAESAVTATAHPQAARAPLQIQASGEKPPWARERAGTSTSGTAATRRRMRRPFSRPRWSAIRCRRVKVAVLTTSYPRSGDPIAGRFVADAVEGIRAQGIEVAVVSPASFRHFGIAYGHGIAGNLRARPWLVVLLPLFLLSFRRAAKRVDADLVHAHWLAAGAVAATLRRPFVVQVWGTDVELARRAPWLARWILRRARLVIAASSFLAEEARALGARTVRVVPSGVAIPSVVGA